MSFEILETEVLKTRISILLAKENCNEIHVNTSRQAFENWLVETNRLEWELRLSEAGKLKCKTTGKMTLEEHKDSELYNIDLLEYITTQRVSFGMKHLVAPEQTETLTESINSKFKSY